MHERHSGTWTVAVSYILAVWVVLSVNAVSEPLAVSLSWLVLLIFYAVVARGEFPLTTIYMFFALGIFPTYLLTPVVLPFRLTLGEVTQLGILAYAVFKTVRHRWKGFKAFSQSSGWELVIAISVLSGLLGLLWTNNFNETLRLLKYFSTYAFVFVLLLEVESKMQFWKLMRRLDPLFVSAAVLLPLFSIFPHLMPFGENMGSIRNEKISGFERVFTPAMLVLPMWVLWHLAQWLVRHRTRSFALACIGIGGLLFTFTRGIFVLLLVSVIFLGGVKPKFWLSFGGVVGLALLIPPVRHLILARFSLGAVIDPLQVPNMRARLGEIAMALSSMDTRGLVAKLVGVGLGYSYPQYGLTYFNAPNVTYMSSLTENGFFNVYYLQGILGVLVFSFFSIKLFKMFRTAVAYSNKGFRPFYKLPEALFIYFLGMGMTSGNFQNSEFIIVLSFAALLAHLLITNREVHARFDF